MLKPTTFKESVAHAVTSALFPLIVTDIRNITSHVFHALSSSSRDNSVILLQLISKIDSALIAEMYQSVLEPYMKKDLPTVFSIDDIPIGENLSDVVAKKLTTLIYNYFKSSFEFISEVYVASISVDATKNGFNLRTTDSRTIFYTSLIRIPLYKMSTSRAEQLSALQKFHGIAKTHMSISEKTILEGITIGDKAVNQQPLDKIDPS